MREWEKRELSDALLEDKTLKERLSEKFDRYINQTASKKENLDRPLSVVYADSSYFLKKLSNEENIQYEDLNLVFRFFIEGQKKYSQYLKLLKKQNEEQKSI